MPEPTRSKPRTIKLTEGEIDFGTYIGIKRMETVNEKCLQVPTGQPTDQDSQMRQHIMGALSELAIAKFTGRYWQAHIGTPDDGGDVGELAVRSTERPPSDRPRLIILPRDDEKRTLVFVIAKPPYFSIRGWCYGKEFRRKEWWQDPTGRNFWAWFVPEDYLYDPELLTTQITYYENRIREYPSQRRHFMTPVRTKHEAP